MSKEIRLVCFQCGNSKCYSIEIVDKTETEYPYGIFYCPICYHLFYKFLDKGG